MINIQPIINSAIDANKKAYTDAYNRFNEWAKADFSDGSAMEYRIFYRTKMNTIEETILNMFGKANIEYIETQFTNIRFDARNK